MRGFLFIFRSFGLDPLKFISSVVGTPRFIFNYFLFSFRAKKPPIRLAPVLTDYNSESGFADGHYFWQDLICATWILNNKPQAHLDIGSRIDGFVAHLMTQIKVDIMDIRNQALTYPNVSFVRADATRELSDFNDGYESVSSLHSIEHFGLGRYGDAIDPAGHLKGLRNIASCVKLDGYLYVSFPIGIDSVEFNAQRILDPNFPIKNLVNFELIDFVLIPWKGQPEFQGNHISVDTATKGQCGLYRLKRIE